MNGRGRDYRGPRGRHPDGPAAPRDDDAPPRADRGRGGGRGRHAGRGGAAPAAGPGGDHPRRRAGNRADPDQRQGHRLGGPQDDWRDRRRDGSAGSNAGPRQERNAPRHALREIGFRKLEELSADSGLTIMEKLSNESTLTLFEKLTCEKDLKEDWIRLVVTIMSKVCQVEYKAIVARLFDKICQKQFLDQLILHISRLPYDDNPNRKGTVGVFYEQLCVLCKAMLELTPVLACENLDIVLKRASQELEELPKFEGYDDIQERLKFIREKLKIEKGRLESMAATAATAVKHQQSRFPTKPPTTDFRELSHFPTIDDIVVLGYQKPFLRQNKIDPEVHGAYENVHDYLDVQFRLMREDFIRPLREGISDYRKYLDDKKFDPSKNKKAARIQNIRIYEKVEILRFQTEEERVGIVLNFDPEKKFAPNVKWEYSKRLMVGSLLVLSENEQFSSIVLVTVSRRDEKELKEGRVLVELCEDVPTQDLLRRQFLMVECQVYFGAYSHVLKALKSFDEDSFPLADYIVYDSNERAFPDYQLRALEENRSFKVPLKSDNPCAILDSVSVDVDNLRTWPSAAQMGLDDSQYQAMCGALTNKVMLIQGPPGTGKTFIGLKIAACLLKNENLWRPMADRRPMLVVCYTNHALDQFLSGLMSATSSIVRVGGGCKETLLEQNCIKFLRRNGARPEHLRKLFHNIRQQRSKFAELKDLGDRIRSCASRFKENAAGFVSLKTLLSFGVVARQYGALTDEDILAWLCGVPPAALPLQEYLLNSSEDIVNPQDAAFDQLKFPREAVMAVSMSFSFRVIEGELAEREENTDEIPPEHQRVRNFLANLKRELSSAQYPRYPPNQQQPNPGNRFWQLNINDRWQLYRHWRDSLLAELDAVFAPLLAEIDAALLKIANELATWRMVEDQHIMADYAVIGMTTSFAASRQQILKELKPRIVIVEEAAEVFESHVLVSLAGDVEHLIMIGDHQQLRPNPSVHELAVKYHMNVSLFERLINKGLHYVTLSTQHRMRPEVAKLISPAIYPHLQNHPSVAQFPAVRGVANNVFFLDHKQPEEYVTDAQSYQNSHEARFLSSLVKYLLLQGYEPSKITVLSTYKGQQYYFSKLKQNQSHLKDVRTTVVDNFQGEENDIILLSLVRSNAEDVVGFLKTENRVCVALSRARHGLYIIGNMANMTAADTVWRKVEEELRRQDAVGPELRLHCDRHGVFTPVSKAEDFASCPQGGCQQLCRSLMPCGHDCKQVCHIQDMEHKTARCTEACTRPACALQHPCPQLCYVQPCPPCLVPKEEKLPCGHTARMPCHMDPATYKCKTVVQCTLPHCGHDREAQCHQLARLDSLPCKVPCTVRMQCGHTCRTNCHVREDPNHEKVKCMQSCGQKRHGCTATPEHMCRLVCHQPCEDCTVPVDKTLACGHVHKAKCNENVAHLVCKRECERTLEACGHKCRKKCHEPCEPCEEKVPKKLPACGHVVTMACGQPADGFRNCKEPCQRRRPCGHRCALRCGQDCAAAVCRQLVPYPGNPACGHPIQVPCSSRNSYEPASPELLALCTHPCGALLKPCDHQCGGSCGACLQGRLHQPCKAKCERPLLCGHLCREACPKVCPPCNRKCEQKCVHSSCGNICGKPCAHCKEPCSRRCEHGACDKRCGDQCSFECNEPCLKKLRGCGHDCIGLCGDPCICKECSEDDVTEIFFGTEEDDGARFVLLPDCKHILESSSLNDWMTIKANDNIKPKLCPKCNTPVTTSQRYSNVIKKIAQDMAVVKAQFYDAKKIQSHLEKIAEIREDVPEIAIGDFREFSVLAVEAVRYVQSVEKKMPKGRETGTRKVAPLNTSEAKNLEQKFLILRSITQIVAKAQEDDKFSGPAMAEVVRAVNHLCSNLRRRDLVRLSEQEAYDISRELERLQRLVELLQAESGPSFRQLDAANRAVHAAISKAVRGLLPYTEELDRRVRDQLSKLAQACSVTITRQELDAIVAAMDMLPGHWFRCPNGHLYCITECGGAVEEARCPIEGCGARIGGGSHQLRSDNTVATDIDGATMSAYDNAMRLYR